MHIIELMLGIDGFFEQVGKAVRVGTTVDGNDGPSECSNHASAASLDINKKPLEGTTIWKGTPEFAADAVTEFASERPEIVQFSVSANARNNPTTFTHS